VSDLRTFSRRIKVRVDRLERNSNALFKRTVLAADQAVVLGTPVDTGVARSNWRVSIGGPLSTTVPAFSPGERLGIGEQANAAGALNQARAAVGRRREGQDAYITNNVPYIGALNDGSSRQAPANFVEMGVMAAVSVIRNARIVT
jgi:hypothetical protein